MSLTGMDTKDGKDDDDDDDDHDKRLHRTCLFFYILYSEHFTITAHKECKDPHTHKWNTYDS